VYVDYVLKEKIVSMEDTIDKIGGVSNGFVVMGGVPMQMRNVDAFTFYKIFCTSPHLHTLFIVSSYRRKSHC